MLIYCQIQTFQEQLHCILGLGCLKSAPLPWQKQNELIKCLPLAYFGNFMECVRARMNFRPLLITPNAEEVIQAWGEGEEAKPVAKGY
jgi:hypothetical protein